MLGACEDQYLLPLIRLNQVRQQRVFGSTVYRMNLLGDRLVGAIAACHLNQGWGIEKAISQGFNLSREGSREQEVLALLR